MGWFQRYGIPGTYFILLCAICFAILYPCKIQNEQFKNVQATLILGAITAAIVPAGYVLYITQQLFYLYFTKRVMNALRDSAVFTEESMKSINDEITAETQSMFFVYIQSHRTKKIKPETINLIRNWIMNRNDVMAINLSLIMATIFLIPVIVLYFVLLGFPTQPYWSIAIVLILVILFIDCFCCISWLSLAEQNRQALIGLYRSIGGKSDSILKVSESVKDETQKSDQGTN